MGSVESVGKEFLAFTPALEEVVNIGTMSSVRDVPEKWMCGSGVRVMATPNDTVVGVLTGFCCNNRRMNTVDLSPLANVRHISSLFLTGCTNLGRVDLSPLQHLQSIGESAFMRCTALTWVDGFRALTRLSLIHGSFLSQADALVSIDLSGLQNLSRIGALCFHRCTGLRSVRAAGLHELLRIDENFCSGCTSLTTADLSDLPQLRSITPNFFAGCAVLTSLDLSGASAVGASRGYPVLYRGDPRRHGQRIATVVVNAAGASKWLQEALGSMDHTEVRT